MSKNSIYDIHISEIILRLADASASALSTARLEITSTIGLDTVPSGYNDPGVLFTSTAVNIPSGYTVVPNSHVITYPVTSADTGSNDVLTGSATAVILAATGNTFTVSSTMDITDGATVTTIIGELVITATDPIYYGVKNYLATPNTAGLGEISSESVDFNLISTAVGRLYLVLPTTLNPIVSITDNLGNIWPVSDFESSLVSGLQYYILNYDTQFTGTNIKKLTINYS